MFRLAILLILVFTSIDVFADVKIYLHSVHNSSSGEVTLGEVSSIEGPDGIVSSLKEIRIAKKFYADGFLDRREVAETVSSFTSEQLYIYGSAVKISCQIEDESREQVLVKAGSQIKVIALRKSIRIESYGTAVETGAEGDIISVRMKGQKIVKARVVSKEAVAVEL